MAKTATAALIGLVFLAAPATAETTAQSEIGQLLAMLGDACTVEKINGKPVDPAKLSEKMFEAGADLELRCDEKRIAPKQPAPKRRLSI